MAFVFLPEIIRAFPNAALERTCASASALGNESLPSWYGVSDLAVDTIAAAGLLLAQRVSRHSPPSIQLNRRLSSLWFNDSIQPLGWSLPPTWDAIAGNYLAKDGWVRLHTNANKHKTSALSVLGCRGTQEDVAEAVTSWATP